MLSKPSIAFLKSEIVPLLGAHKATLTRSIALVLVTPIALLLSLELARRCLEEVTRLDEDDYAFVATGGLALLSLFAGYGLMFLRDRRLDVLAARLIASLRTRGFSVVIHMIPRSAEQLTLGTLVKRLVGDTAEIRTLLMEGVLLRIADAIMALVFVIYAFVLDAQMAAVAITVVMLFFSFARWTSLSARERLRSSDSAHEAFTSTVEEALRRWEDVHGGHSHAVEVEKTEATAIALEESTVATHRWLLIDRIGTTAITAAGPLVILLIGGVKIIGGTLSVDELVAFMGVTTVLYKPANELSALPMLLQRSTIAVDNLRELFTAARAHRFEAHAGSLSLDSSGGAALSMTDVTVSIGGWSLRIPSFVARTGERIAIVGPSGAGKSTLLRLIHGQEQVASGTMAVRDELLRRGSVRLLTQTSTPFSGTLLDNVRLWSERATAEEVRAILDMVALSSELDDATERRLRPDGAGLSGGQLRRVLLARAGLSDSRVLLLDEPMTGVELARRAAILAGLLEHMGSEVCVVASTHESELAKLFTRRYRVERVSETESLVVEEA